MKRDDAMRNRARKAVEIGHGFESWQRLVPGTYLIDKDIAKSCDIMRVPSQ